MNKETLTLAVPYTLTMVGSGTFIAEWKPVVPSNEYPSYVQARSSSSGIKALERLHAKLILAGVIS